MTDALPTLIVVTGPTAVGKTRVAIELAQYLSTEIISCDSRQIYRELNIGVARPSPGELAVVPHHMIGFLPVEEPYNAFRFESDVISLLTKLFISRNKVVMAGGSGLYIHAVTHGIDTLPDPEQELRQRLNEKLQTEGIEALENMLKTLDPAYHSEVDTSNPKRLVRALEVCLATGRPYSSFRTGNPAPRPFHVVKVGLTMDRGLLNDRINLRVDQMMEHGLLEEARSLYHQKEVNALNTVGYKELFHYMDGLCTLEKAVEKIKTNTRRYAKRQMTWLRKDTEIQWFEPDRLDQIIAYAETKDEGRRTRDEGIDN